MAKVTPIYLGPEIYEAHDRYMDALNSLLRKAAAGVTQISYTKTSSKGVQYDYFELQSKIMAVDYKIRYAAVCLDKIRTMHEEQRRALDEQNDFMGDKVPLTEDFSFHTDVMLTFISSAWDLASWTVQLVHGSTISSNKVFLRKICENLKTNPNPEYELFRTLFQATETGWISKFEGYRNFVTHHGKLHVGRNLAWSQGAGLDVGIILLPDDPLTSNSTYNKGKEVLQYGKEAMVMALGFIASLYEFVSGLV